MQSLINLVLSANSGRKIELEENGITKCTCKNVSMNLQYNLQEIFISLLTEHQGAKLRPKACFNEEFWIVTTWTSIATNHPMSNNLQHKNVSILYYSLIEFRQVLAKCHVGSQLTKPV